MLTSIWQSDGRKKLWPMRKKHEEMKGRIYEEYLTISKEHLDGEYVGYDASINVVPANTVELIS